MAEMWRGTNVTPFEGMVAVVAITKAQTDSIEDVLKKSLQDKFRNYKPEPASMPFHTRLLGKDRLALYSFIHSLSTNFGTTVFEPVALALAKTNFKKAEARATAGSQVSDGAQRAIQTIMDGLTTASATPDKPKEVAQIRAVCRMGNMHTVKLTKVDILLESASGELYLFDLKTVKPNVGGFKEFKRTLLEWTAASLASDAQRKVNTLIAIPYNPYEPQPYNRWTMRGMLDLKNELKVAEEFWDFVGGAGAFVELLGCFERVGLLLRPEIDAYFARFHLIK